MQVYCEKCGNKQNSDERICSKCGTPFGGELWVLIVGIAIVISPAILVFTEENLGALLYIKIFFWYQLPTIVSTAFLYDYHPTRRGIYFWGGAVIILASLYILAKPT